MDPQGCYRGKTQPTRPGRGACAQPPPGTAPSPPPPAAAAALVRKVLDVWAGRWQDSQDHPGPRPQALHALRGYGSSVSKAVRTSSGRRVQRPSLPAVSRPSGTLPPGTRGVRGPHPVDWGLLLTEGHLGSHLTLPAMPGVRDRAFRWWDTQGTESARQQLCSVQLAAFIGRCGRILAQGRARGSAGCPRPKRLLCHAHITVRWSAPAQPVPATS